MLPDALYQTDRAQHFRRVIDQIQESYNADQTKERRDERDKLVNTGPHPARCLDRENECENENAGRIADDVVAQQCRRDDSRRVLPTGDLNCHEKRPKCEDGE